MFDHQSYADIGGSGQRIWCTCSATEVLDLGKATKPYLSSQSPPYSSGGIATGSVIFLYAIYACSFSFFFTWTFEFMRSNTPTIIVSDHPLAFCYYVIVFTSNYLIFWVPSVSTTAVLNLLFVSISEFPSTGFSVCFEMKLLGCMLETIFFLT